jgi:WD40 repeat protein
MVPGGMGDADADVKVESPDPEDTIDGAEARPERNTPPVEMVAAVRDYPELLEVERRHYAIVRELAKGGVGRVLEARDLRLGRRVAIKELLPRNRHVARRFEREARITARLQHPSIIHVYEAGTWQGGEPFYAMPIVQGRSLDKVVAEKKTLAQRIALLPHVIAVADALAYAHNENVIHRDLKPANVLVGEYGETVVIDWGLAKDLGVQGDPKESMRLPVRGPAEETASGSVVGTPAYMAPEQARGDGVDPRVDVYALGALLYKVLSGRAPYQGRSSEEVIAQVKAGPPVPIGELVPDAPPDLVAIVTTAMARYPRDRYATASELAQDLKRFETGQLVGAHDYTAGQLLRRWLRRYRVAVAIGAVAGATLAIVGAISVQNVVAARDHAEFRRVALLEERGRSELLAGHAGAALAYLAGAAHDGHTDGARGFLIAEAMRPFQAEVAPLMRDRGNVVVAASPDGKHVANASADRIELWTTRGVRERVLAETGATALAFDHGSTELAASGDDGIVRVWRLDGTPLAELKAGKRAIVDLAFSIDGRLATAGADGVAQVWNLASGTSVVAKCARLDEQARLPALLTVRFDSTGKYAAVGAEDGTGCVWNTFDPDETTPLRGHTGPIEAIRWSPDGAWVATASEDGTARVWSPTYGKALVNPMQHGHPVDALEVSGDGSLLVTGDADGGVWKWQIPSRLPTVNDGTMVPVRESMKLGSHTNRVVAIAFSPDDELVATAGADRVATVWETRTGGSVATFEQSAPLTSVAFAGQQLVTGDTHGMSRVWDPAVVAARPHLIDSPVHAIAVSRSGVVAAARDDSNVELVSPAPAMLQHHDGSVFAAGFTPDGATLVTAGAADEPIAWDVARHAPRVLQKGVPPYRMIAMSPDGAHFATGPDVRLWSLRDGSGHVLDAGGATIRALAYSPDGELLVGGAWSGARVAWDGEGRRLSTIETAPATAVAFSPVGSRLAVGGLAQARVYRVEHGRISATPLIAMDGVPGEVRALLFACAGACLVTGSDAGTVQVWDAARGKLLATHDPHAGAVSGLALGDHGTKLWISTEGNTVSSWDIHVETRPARDLDCFMAGHVPWRLDSDDVATEGEPHGQRGSDCK